ncbi:hypothetical protein N7457_005419 [Penicillium paradoxum]|uniref:uncharacterized protein n=1 Tax=Penicillium paradoxum TaxID=176176 RepID=UPI002546FFD5|nr:uncharacterized protein N7457_005419 [Penicillium paradoxum]KAJ5780259.1 hypothetical protein N7457_005419 [Penicillium paradoxum]
MSPAKPAVSLDSLPNEVFVETLSDFSTRELLPLISVNHRFHALVLRILHYRLLLSTPLKEYTLLLECFHPSSKLTEPHVFCKYLGTDGLTDRHDGAGSLYEDVNTAQQLGRVTGLYSRFRPEASRDEEDEQRGDNAHLGLSQGAEKESAVIREFTIDGYEDFSQLCVVANLVQVRPGTSLLLSASTIEDGFVRLWRDWLHRQSRKMEKATETAREEGSANVSVSSSSDDILWVDTGKTVGLKMRVRPKAWNPSFPILIHQDDRDDNAWVGYEVILEELHIRSTRLLLVVEQAKEEQEMHQSNAIVIGAPTPALLA